MVPPQHTSIPILLSTPPSSPQIPSSLDPNPFYLSLFKKNMLLRETIKLTHQNKTKPTEERQRKGTRNRLDTESPSLAHLKFSKKD